MQVDVQCIIHIASEVVNNNMDDKIHHVLSDVIWNSVANIMESVS